MAHKIGDTVRARRGTGDAELLQEAAPLVGTVGDASTDRHGDMVSVVYEDAQVYANGLPASDFEPASSPADDEPF